MLLYCQVQELNMITCKMASTDKHNNQQIKKLLECLVVKMDLRLNSYIYIINIQSNKTYIENKFMIKVRRCINHGI